MKSFGIALAITSTICLIFALNMKTTVGYAGGSVNNIGLIKDQQNYITVSALFLIIGLGFYFFYAKESSLELNKIQNMERKIPSGSMLKEANLIQFKSDEMRLDNDAYKLYLIQKYKISKNEVLNQFVLNSKIYETIGDVLDTAHNIELQESMEAEEKLRKNSEKISKNISINDSYKLYLIDKYKISRNETSNKFILANNRYQNLDEAIIAAHEREKIESKHYDGFKNFFK